MKIICAAVVLSVMATAAAGADDVAVKLPLKEAFRLAVEKNLDLKVEIYNPAQSEAELRRSRGIYDLHLTADTSYLYASTLSVGRASASNLKTFKITPGAYQLIPTGGTVSATFNNTYTSTDAALAAFSNYWQSDLTLALDQPLLKNFGRDTTELNIQVAAQGKEASLQRYRQRILGTVAQVQSEYFRLFSLRETLEARKVSLELARRILSETKGRVAAGVLPAMEILNAEFGVSSREKDLIDADRSVRDAVDSLRVLLQLEPNRDIIPLDPPSRGEVTVQEAEAIKRAQTLRPELADLQAQLMAAEMQERVAQLRTKPDLNLSSSLAVTGVGEGYGRDLERVGSGKYPVWSIGLKLDYPLGNQTAENDYVKSRLRTEQLRVQQESLRDAVGNEVRAAIRAVSSGYKQLEVSDRNRAYAEERLKAYSKKHEVGLATTKDLLDVENDLSSARSNQSSAQAAYAIAVVQLLKVTGELLEREGITVTAATADHLLDKAR